MRLDITPSERQALADHHVVEDDIPVMASGHTCMKCLWMLTTEDVSLEDTISDHDACHGRNMHRQGGKCFYCGRIG